VRIGGWIFALISIGRAAAGDLTEIMSTSHVVGIDYPLRAYHCVPNLYWRLSNTLRLVMPYQLDSGSDGLERLHRSVSYVLYCT
jgi:hypothetical protein